MHETRKPNETAFVIHPVLPGGRHEDSYLNDRLEEACGLARAINLEVVHADIMTVNKVSPAQLLSKGLLERLTQQVKEQNPTVVILDTALSPGQQRNLETALQTKVIDRTGLILEIFGERAQTREGRIQVDLALLEYQRSRLVRAWTHLERQRGGAGFMGGPGETQIEIDRRLIGQRISKLKKELEDVRRTRNLAKETRQNVPYPVVALVGYTNAGKSTLFNKLTGANVYAEDLPFATLDPTMRQLKLPSGQEVIFSDTVGFISDLPTHLVAAFRATLEQVTQADIILHVRDISRTDHATQAEDVNKILTDLGVEVETDPRILEVWNKIDLLEEDDRGEALRKTKFDPAVIAVSAVTGEGLEHLLNAINANLTRDHIKKTVTVDAANGKALAWLYSHGEVLEQKEKGAQIIITARLSKPMWDRYKNL